MRLTSLFFAVVLSVGCGSGAAPSVKFARAPVAPRVILGDLDASLLLDDIPARAARLGAGPVSIVASGEAVENERIGAFVEVPADACLLAYARASSSVEDIDVAAFADEGNPIAADEAPDAHPTILLCPPHPERIYLAVHTAGGEGLVALAAQVVPRDRAAEVGRALGARGGQGGGPRPADAWPGLDDHVRAHRTALGGTWEEFRRIALTLDARSITYAGLPLEANQCVDAVIVPDDDVALLEVEALDGEGRVVARAHEGVRDRTLTLCSPVSFSGSLAIRPHVGGGLAAVVLAKARGEVARDFSGRPDVAWVASPLSLEASRASRNADLARAGYGAPSASTNGALVLGRRVTIPLDLGVASEAKVAVLSEAEAKSGRPAPRVPATCSRIDVVGGAPLALLDASVWDPSGSLLASAGASGSIALFVCGRARAQLELESRGRPGPFSVLARSERWKDAAFAAHPLASARMMARAASGPSMMHEGFPLAAKSFSLDPGRRISYGENLNAGQCVKVAVGVEGEGSGVELRVFDAGSSDELDRSVAEWSAAVRACASPTGPRSVRVEIRGTSGRLEAIVGERLTGG